MLHYPHTCSSSWSTLAFCRKVMFPLPSSPLLENLMPSLVQVIVTKNTICTYDQLYLMTAIKRGVGNPPPNFRNIDKTDMLVNSLEILGKFINRINMVCTLKVCRETTPPAP